MHRTMADVMKAMGGAKRGPMAGLANMLGLGGGLGRRHAGPEQMAKLAEKMPGGLPPVQAGALPPNLPGLPGGLPGGALPGRASGRWPEAAVAELPPGFPGLGKKK